MIVSKVEDKEAEKKEIEFPILMESIYNGAVVLFTDNSTGTLLKKGLTSEVIGEYSKNWNPADTHWKPLKGNVTLYNSGE